MKTIIVAALISMVAAAPQFPFQRQYRPQPQPQFRPQPQYQPQPQPQYQARTADGAAQVLRYESEVNEAGFQYAYETSNGIRGDEAGQEADGIQAQGSFSYTGPDGQPIQVTYTAGANGFQPQGAHLPTPPPVPEEIARSLQQNAADEAAGIFDDGSYHEGKYAAGTVPARAFSSRPSGRVPSSAAAAILG